MKKILYILLSSAVLTSCILENADNPSRTSYSLMNITQDLVEIAAQNPALVMDNCFRAQDFISCDATGRNAYLYSSMSYEETTNCVNLENWGTITTDGKSLSSEASKWHIKTDIATYTVTRIGDNQWEIVWTCSNNWYTLRNNTQFKATFTFNGKDSNGFCTWNCKVEALYKESETYHATLSCEDLSFGWTTKINNYGQFTSSLGGSGTATARFFVNGQETDWCTATYENGELTKHTSSLD